MKRIPALDGVRALAVLLVVCVHLPSANDSGTYNALWKAAQAIRGGYVGVDLFFVLSGFLITRILVAEKASAGRISFRNFYFKRCLRIVPVYYVALLACLWAAPMPGGAALSLLTYTFNYYHAFNAVPHPLEQTWSLSVEEQFYMVWPWLIALLPLRFGRLATGVVVPLIALAAAAGIALLVPNDETLSGDLIYMSAATRMLSLSLGGWLAFHERALALDEGRAHPVDGGRRAGLRGWLALIAAGVVTLAIDRAGRHSPLIPTHGVYWTVALFGYASGCLGAIGLVVFAPGVPGSLLRRLLAFAPARALGRISYGLYVYHLPVLFALGLNQSDMAGRGARIADIGLAAGLSLALAVASWFVIEQPLLALKGRLRPARPALRRPAMTSASAPAVGHVPVEVTPDPMSGAQAGQV